jgi:hypothetical protein
MFLLYLEKANGFLIKRYNLAFVVLHGNDEY